MNNILTASRMSTLLACAHRHYWHCEVGLTRVSTGYALRFGSAWARAMEARWAGKTYEEALAAAVPVGVDLDEYACSTVAALLAAYYDYYGEREDCAQIHPEVHFGPRQLGDSPFQVDGKMDGLGTKTDGRSVLVEGKTTGDSLAPDSEYWMRLRFNLQVMQYVTEARVLGWDIAEVIYDVTRKPSIRPKEVYDLDERKMKIVLDAHGKRIYLAGGKGKGQPRQTGDKEKGYTVKSHVETPDEFCDRLYRDALSRPAFYFCRREIPVIDAELEAFDRLRWSLAELILHYRREQEWMGPDAWPKAITRDNCKFCSFKDFCLQNIKPDLDNLPQGFEVQQFNPELNDTDAAIAEAELESSETSG